MVQIAVTIVTPICPIRAVGPAHIRSRNPELINPEREKFPVFKNEVTPNNFTACRHRERDALWPVCGVRGTELLHHAEGIFTRKFLCKIRGQLLFRN
jgi:hypothetical protein